MNLKFWNQSNVPLSILALKLSEEAAEVGTLITDAWKLDRAFGTANWVRDLKEELTHVEEIAKAMRRSLDSGGCRL